MELGATVCTPRAPRCDQCPVAGFCRARALGTPEAFPARRKQPPVRAVSVDVLWVERRGRVLLERQRPEGPLRGAWDLPAAVVTAGRSHGRAIVRGLSARHGLRVHAGGVLLHTKHAILASRLAIDVIEAVPLGGLSRRAALRWVPLDRLDDVAISGATAKIARAVVAQRRSHDLLTSSSSGSRGRVKA
jgi:A/G-specific adenine glycosylase